MRNTGGWKQSYWWALSILKPYRKKIVIVSLCSMLAVASETITPKIIQFIIDDVLEDRNMSLFMWLIIILCSINILMLAAKNVGNLLQREISELASKDLQNTIFSHLRKLGFAHYERHPAGETLSMFNSEVASVQRMYRNYLPSVIENFMFVIVAITILISISGALSLMIVPTIGLYYLIGPYFEKKAVNYGRLTGEARIRYNQGIYESISGLREFRAFRSQGWYHARTYDNHNKWARIHLYNAAYAFARGSVRRLSFYIGAIGVFTLGYHGIVNDWLSLGEFIAFSMLFMTTTFKLTVLVTLLTEQRMIIDQIEPLYQFMHKPIEIKESDDPIVLDEVKGSLTFENISFAYPGQPPVLKGFDLQVRSGEKVAFVGASGGGKTTLFKMIGRFYDPSSGHIRLDGAPIQELSLAQLRGAIGYVFQETYLFGSSVKENIRFGKPEATDEDIIAAAKSAYAHDFIMQLPEGYDTVVGERGMKLSGGQKQRISIARMFIKQPAIILLDEATSSLDNVSEAEVQKALDEILVGRTTIAIAHRLSTVKHFDTLVVVQDGVAAEIGSYDELIARKGLLYLLEQGEKQHEAVLTQGVSS